MDFQLNKINPKEMVTFQNEGNYFEVHQEAKLVETTRTMLNR